MDAVGVSVYVELHDIFRDSHEESTHYYLYSDSFLSFVHFLFQHFLIQNHRKSSTVLTPLYPLFSPIVINLVF